ncbi:MAG: hypothetical protein VXY16_08245 [Pseudomonadota bacterium]|nr:hypothetical protein [Pseudomonadota bacterium]
MNLKITESFLPDKNFFEDSEDRILFLPWGYCGDCLSVSLVQKDTLKLVRLLCFIFSLALALAMYMHMGRLSYSLIIIPTYIGAFLWLCFLLVFFKNNKSAIFDVGRYGHPRLLKGLWQGLLLNGVLTFLGLYAVPDDKYMIACVILLVCFFPLAIFVVWRSKGYIFTKKPSLSD